MKLAYLVNQYPSISHSFIRREIEALERQGVSVSRFTIRSSAHGTIAEEDRRETEKTRRIVGAGAGELAPAISASLVSRPFGSIRAAAAAIGLGWRSETGLLHHLFYFAEALALASFLRRQKLRHIHAHFGTNSATVALLAARINGGSFSMTVHGPEEFDKAQLIALPQKIMRAAFVAAVSSYGASQLRRLVPPESWGKICVVPCGVEASFYAGDIAPPTDEARFVSVGRLCQQKGQLTLIEAAAEARRRGGRFSLVLIGDGEMRGDVEAAIERLGLRDDIVVAGWKPPAEVRAAIETARVFVLSSYAEGLPVSIMEAMALERPVIATYVAGIPELVVPETGWLVPAGDVGALADALMQAIAAPREKIAIMGRAGRERALRRHDADKIAADLKSMFAKVA